MDIKGVMADAAANSNERDVDELIAASRELIVQARLSGSIGDPLLGMTKLEL